jgi:hypothetical protein
MKKTYSVPAVGHTHPHVEEAHDLELLNQSVFFPLLTAAPRSFRLILAGG